MTWEWIAFIVMALVLLGLFIWVYRVTMVQSEIEEELIRHFRDRMDEDDQ